MTLSCSTTDTEKNKQTEDFKYVLEQFADLRILRYQVSGFDELSLQQKKLIYYLSQAAVSGRDILWDQNGKYNLAIRKTLENIYNTYSGDRTTEEYNKFLVYIKRVWFSNGIYHHYSTDKIMPGFSKDYFRELVSQSDNEGFPQIEGLDVKGTLDVLIPVMFDEHVLNKKVNQDPEKDLVTASAVNFYQQVNEEEVSRFYKTMKDPEDNTPVSYGLNSRVVKENGVVKEMTWKADGLYGEAISQIIYWLEKAAAVADTPAQLEEIEKLIAYYKTGDLELWDEYNVLWVNDTSRVDFVNGFIETYSDPLGMKATWESVVNFKDLDATKRTEIIASNAQWFEDHSPVDGRFKKQEVKGISAKVITVAMLGGDCYPHTPIGINLPNADWIRKVHGSKSVTLENITDAYNQANLGSGFLEEFSYDSTEMNLVKEYGPLAGNITTDLHEILGHGSGQLLEGVSPEALKNYHSPLEETRADLFALYYIMDPKLIELGLLPNKDAAKAEYIAYFRNGLMTQLKRIEPGNDIQQAHMRNRQLISGWCFEKGLDDNVIEEINRDGKTYYKIHDFNKLRELVGKLLAEVQRIKSEGDYEAGRKLVETYGVKVDPELHREVLARFDKLDIAPYSGFVNPEYEITEKDGEITDVKVTYTDDFAGQMLKYGKEYSFLPVMNR
ncbi:MAG: dihydrofolate reductase [Bacteroidales bacterium]